MNKTALLSLIFVVLVQPFAHAQEDWAACRETSECLVDEAPCGGPIPLNKKFLAANRKKNAEVRPRIRCMPPEGPKPEAYRAVCKATQCVLELK